jgi:hypothetical protein
MGETGRGLIAGDLIDIYPEMLAEFLSGGIPAREEEICLQRVIS